MSKVTQESKLTNTPEEERWNFQSQINDEVKTILNNGLTFTDNFAGKITTVTFSAANTDVAVAHGLGRVPTGYLIISSGASMSVYTGSSAWTSNLIYLRSSATGTVGVIVF